LWSLDLKNKFILILQEVIKDNIKHHLSIFINEKQYYICYMNKKIINSQNAPAPIGPYNQAIEVNGFLFVSGQIALIPGTNDIALESIEIETKQVMNNLQAILIEADLSFEHVVKTSIFLSDMNHFATVNTVYANYFTSNYPARETIQVAGLPRGVNVEISMIVAKG
jgi:2-iminobutanoate/2-iminopropanoate deaminase